MSPRTKRPKPKTKCPHHMAFQMDAPCPKCGSEWGRPGIVMDPDAEELPTITLCAGCKARIP